MIFPSDYLAISKIFYFLGKHKVNLPFPSVWLSVWSVPSLVTLFPSYSTIFTVQSWKRPLAALHNLSINFSRKFGDGVTGDGTDQTDSHTPRNGRFNLGLSKK